MKKTIAIMLVVALLWSVALFVVGCQVAEVAPASEPGAEAAAPASEDLSAVVAKIGDEVITLGDYQALFDMYNSFYSMYGMDVTSDATQLAEFQDNVLNTLLQDAVIKYQAKQQGLDALTADQETEATKRGETSIAEVEQYYRDMAEGAAAEDSSIDVDQYIEERIMEESEYYTGTAMGAEEYKAYIAEQERDNYIAEILKAENTKALSVTDDEVKAWYDENLASQKTAYTETPSAYKDDEEGYEMAPSEEGATPVLYAPEGYSRVMDIMIAPTTTASAANADYDEKIASLGEMAQEYGNLAFEDAAAGTKANAARLSEIMGEYKAMKAETDAMETAVEADAKKAIEEAYAQLKDQTFESLMLRATQSPDFLNCEKFMMEGRLISAKYDSESDWSPEVKEAFAKLKQGEYSPVVKDDQGFHILYYVGDEPAGERALADVKTEIHQKLLTDKQAAEWTSMVEAWMQDETVELHEDVYRGVGKAA